MAQYRLTRRGLIKSSAAAASSLAAAPFIRVGPLRSKLKIAAIGAANRGAANIAGVLGEDVAVLCDVDEAMLARGVGQGEKAGQRAPRTFADWRELLSEVDDLDGVVVSTPDHLHAAISRAALRRGLPVYCEKPLTRTVQEARELETLAAEAGVPTQMGTQIHATDNYRRVVEAIEAGVIGDVDRVDVMCATNWSNGKFGTPSPVPEGLAWDLWLGPTQERPYSEGIHPAHWRRFWQFGSGTVGDMACHWVDLVHWALDLSTPASIAAEGPEPDAVGAPEGMHATWYHEKEGERGPVEVHWWDAGRCPDGEGFEDAPANCHVFRGTKGRIVSTYGSMNVRLDDEGATWEAPPHSIPSSVGHYEEWLSAIRDDGPADAPLCSFDYASKLTQTVLLATVAFRAGERIDWDADNGTVSAGSEYLAADERDGWDV